LDTRCSCSFAHRSKSKFRNVYGIGTDVRALLDVKKTIKKTILTLILNIDSTVLDMNFVGSFYKKLCSK
jgi:hypothetical protein